MKFTKFALNRPVTVLMASFAVVLIGIIAWQRLSLELLPSMNYPQITVLTTYENVAPSEIESLISKQIEEAVGTVKGVKRITSVSKEGVSIITLDFEWNIDTNLAALDVREKIDVIKNNLPKDVENPIIIKFDPAAFPIMTIGLSGQGSKTELTKIATDEIKQKLERIPGVALARISGAVEREIVIAVDQGRLFAYNIPISDLVDKLKSANFNFPGGKIEGSRDEIRIRTMGQFKSLKDIESIVIAKGKGSIPIFLRDVATVNDSFKEQTSAFTVNGQESIGISVFKQADSNTVRVAEDVTQEIERLQKELNLKINMVIVYNQADFIKDAITDLNLAGLMGGFLAFLVLLLFLRGFRSALIITTAIPISILGTVFLMYASGISLNIMSLGGLALGVGMLVDNGIVILENTYRHRQNIPDIYEASIVGADEMRNPVIASTFAHIIVFLPIMFVKDLAGKFFTQLALTISFSLLISILVALMLNPVLETRRLTYLRKPITFMRLPFFHFSRLTQVFKALIPKVLEPSWQFVGSGMKKLEELYLKLLSLAITESNRKKVLLIAIVTLAISITCIPFMGKEFVPSVDQGSFVLKVTAPPGTSLKAMDRTASEVQKLLSEEPGVNTVFVNIGYDEKEKTEKALGEVEQNVARITVVLSEGMRKRTVSDVVTAVRPRIAEIANIEVEYILNQDVYQLLRQKQKAPELLEIRGPDLETIKGITAEAIKKLQGIQGLKDIKSSLEEDETEIQISVDREKAASFKLNVKDVADALKTSMEGDIATKYRDADQDVDIRIRLRDEERKNIPNLERILIHTPLKSNIQLREVAKISTHSSLRQIQHRDLSRVSVISANITGMSASECFEKVKRATADITVPQNYTISISTEQEETNRSFRNLLFAFILSILLVYMLLASMFESFLDPFMIMLAVPLEAVGIVLALLLTGSSISLGVFIGMIMLSGIVVNNSIILVDYINRLRKKGMAIQEALLEGGRVRLRPIIMTTLTTTLGLIPLAIGLGKGSEMRTPLAITVIGGLMTSTFMTLIIIPVVYTFIEDIKKFSLKPKNEMQR